MKCTKRIISIILVLVLLVGTCVSGLVVPAAAKTANLFPNGDFEEFGEASPTYAPWTPFEASKNSTIATVKNGIGVDGSWGLEMGTAGGAGYTKFASALTFEEGKTYRLSFMAKGATVNGNAALVQVYKTTNLTYVNNSTNTVYLRPGKTTDEWVSYCMEFTAGANASWDASYSLLVNRGSDTGNIVFDNFVLEEVTEDTNRVTNGDFEKAYDRMFYEAIRDGKLEPATKATDTNAYNKTMKLLATETGWDSAWMKGMHLKSGYTYNISFDYIGGAFGMYASATHGEFENGTEFLSFGATDTWTSVQVSYNLFSGGSNDWAFSFLKRSSSKQNVADTYIDNIRIVKAPEATGIELDTTAVELEIGTEKTVSATFIPSGASTQPITWTSSDETVATVANGKITAVAVGTATITATAGSLTATCAVTVKPSPIKGTEFTLADMAGHYKTQGRIHKTTSRLYLDWSASGFEFMANCAGDVYVKFQVESIDATYGCYFTVLVDGIDQGRAACHITENGTQKIKIASDLPAGEHRFEIYRQSTMGSTVSINGVIVDGTLSDAPANNELYIEFIGDSITVAQGNLWNSSIESTSNPLVTNATQGYAYITAHDKLGADFATIAVSGIGASVGWTNYNMQQVYPKLRYQKDSTTDYDFARQPDIVVLALGTNDMNRREYHGKTLDDIKQGFHDMLALVREKNPNAKVVWIHGMMLSSASPIIQEVVAEAGGADAGVYELRLTQNNKGGNGHPDVDGHLSFANDLSAYIRQIMTPTATAIELNKTAAEMKVGDTLTLSVTGKPAGAEVPTITWTSSNNAVATVKNGQVSAVKAGTTTITATAGTLVATCVVTVNTVKATAVELDRTSVQMEVGDVTTLKATFMPAGAEEETITWKSSNEAVVKVVNGKLTAQKVGIAVVTATAGSLKASCAVAVSPTEFTIPEMEGHYKTQGRVYYSGARMYVDWTASGIEFSANCAGDVYVTFQADNITSGDREGCYFTIYVDGAEQNRTTCHLTTAGTHRVKIASALKAGEHRFEIYRQTQIGNKVSINSVTLDGKLSAAPKQSDLNIEFIGDSITVGSGNLATSSDSDTGSAYYSNGTKTYAFMAAHDKLKADYSMVAISGIGASVGWTTYNMQEVYPCHRYPVDKTTLYDFAKQPDVVVLALGTNDMNRYSTFGKTTEDVEQGFADMLALVRQKNPNAKIVWIHGMMLGSASSIIQHVVAEAGGEKAGLYTLYLPQNNSGGNGHPNLSGHMEYAETLSAYLKKIMAPAAPTVSSKTDTKVVLKTVKGYEYSRDGKKWQTSATFSGLTAGTYSFYQRKAETTGTKAGLASAALKVTVTGHKYTNACDKTCNYCGATRTTSHSYTKKVTKATLTANGKVYHQCNVCDYIASTSTTVRRPYSFKLSATSYTYNGAVKTPTVTVKDTAGKTLKKNTDYTVTYASGRKNTGTYTVKVTMKGNYTGTKTLSFKINPISISKCKLSLSTTAYTYDGKVKTPSVVVKNANGTKLTKNTHYTVTYATGRKNAGTYKVTVKMKGNYSGTKTLTFKINPISISKCKLSLSATSYTYDGKVKTPSVVVKNASGTKLTKNTHYTVTYATGRKNVGTYKVTVKMKGNYSGTKTLTFKVIPAKTTVSKLTPATKSLKVSITKKSTQVTGYQVQYSTSKSFSSPKTVTISSYKTTSTTIKSLKAKTTYYVRVRTYKTVNGTKYYSGWSTVKYAKTK